MSPAELRQARITLGLSERGLAVRLKMTAKNSARTIRDWEDSRNGPVPGAVAVAVGYMLKEAGEADVQCK